MVYVEKGGEIIPKITAVDKEARFMRRQGGIYKNALNAVQLVRNEDEAAHYCPNEDGCPQQKRQNRTFCQPQSHEYRRIG